MISRATLRTALLTASLLALTHTHAADPARIQALAADVRGGPSTYHTSAAVEYVSRTQGITMQSPMPEFTERAVKALRAAATLGEIGSGARDAVPALIDVFPVAVHASTVYETYQTGEGSIEDWVQTKVMGEKNKFLMSSPFLSYESLSRCDRFIEVKNQHALAGEQYGSGRRLLSASVTVHVQFTVYVGACALNAITGVDFGSDAAQWRNWWAMAGQSSAPAPAPAPAPAAAPATIGTMRAADVVVGGTYRFTLTTGDVFTAAVESKSDTSLIAETKEGNAYTFRIALIRQCELISLPANLAKQPGGQTAGMVQAELLSYDQLKQRSPQGVVLEVKIKSGQVFEGTFVGIQDDNIKLNVGGSVIPFHKDVILQVATVPPRKPEPAAAPVAPEKPQGPFDTLVVRNPKTDEWGKPLANFLYVGVITEDYGDQVTMKRSDGATVVAKRSEVERIIKHSEKADPEVDAIQRYAKQLFCPKDMILVDLPPGKQGRPYFKVCIDKYEYPNEPGVVPRANVSFTEAKAMCESKGKRLCAAEEWQWSCSGFEGLPYAYGHNFDENTCNSSTKGLTGCGSRTNCVSKFGVYDMTGNVFEWTTGKKGEPLLMGGPQSKCTTMSPGLDGSAKPLSGFRCCKSN